MIVAHHATISDVPCSAWDQFCDPDYPFSQHAYLAALELSGSASAATGWHPQHLTLSNADSGEIVGAAPLYRKDHSYGEFVFDFSWANAYQQIGRPYYPKLVCAIPFTPCPGPRLLSASANIRGTLAATLVAEAPPGMSSSHVLFCGADDLSLLQRTDYFCRADIRLEWENNAYADFAQFLNRLRADKRKKIRRERRRIEEAGIRHQFVAGGELDDGQLQQVYELYSRTYLIRGQTPYLSLDFWRRIRESMGEQLLVCLAHYQRRIVAAALFFRGPRTLYGRHWGSLADFDSLHFETCYYQGIDYCIEHGMERFDAGVQGGHRLQRGFTPRLSYSAHHIADPQIASALKRFARQETAAVEAQQAALAARGAFRDTS